MATYAVGDLQGCFHTFNSLLDKISFNTNSDELWLVGDLINRGLNSLEIIHWCYKNKKNIKLVLGNHDLHFLSVALSNRKVSRNDTFDGILSSPYKRVFTDWLISIPLLHHSNEHIMTHAGLLPSWKTSQAIALAKSAADALKKNPEYFLHSMYGNFPDRWANSLGEDDIHRLTVNVLTRMRCLNSDESLDFSYKGTVKGMPENLKPWFSIPPHEKREVALITGHWSAVGFVKHASGYSLDSGCVWGKKLTALCLENHEVYTVNADSRDLLQA